MVLLAKIYYPEGYNRLLFCPREFTTLKGMISRYNGPNEAANGPDRMDKGVSLRVKEVREVC